MKFVVRSKDYNNLLEILKSIRKDFSKLQKVKVVDKNGNARYVYKKIDQIDNKQNSRENDSVMIRQGLKTTGKIADYLEDRLKAAGYEVEREYSGLSGSQYLTISNYSEMTGKESRYNDSELKIRISDHDLPPSYDGLHGYHDIDIISGAARGGNTGAATFYDNALTRLVNDIKPEIRAKAKQQQADERKKVSDMKKNVPQWLLDVEMLKNKLKTTESPDARMFLSELINGGSSTGYKKPNQSQKIKMYNNFLQRIKENPDVKDLYKEIVE